MKFVTVETMVVMIVQRIEFNDGDEFYEGDGYVLKGILSFCSISLLWDTSSFYTLSSCPVDEDGTC